VTKANTTQTLLEQMQITDLEIARRKELLGFTADDEQVLTSCAELVREHIDSIVAEFYAKQTAVDEIALLIGDADTLKRLHSAQRAYVLSLFNGYYDLDYVNDRLRIGMVHNRIGVEPKLYLSAVKTLKDTVISALALRIQDAPLYNRVCAALDKLLYFDTILVFDTYIRGLLTEVESAKDRVLGYARELEAKVAERTVQLQQMAQRDPLTGLYNQRAMRESLQHELRSARRFRKPFSLAFIDLDDFKKINDRDGHFAGDQVLRALADALKQGCRDIDFPCRYGGDEFLVGLPDCTLDAAIKVSERVVELFQTLSPDVTFSIGIAQAGPIDFPEVEALITAADQRMYEAKQQPGFNICT
jgi:diguanylate cyclase (GGDEF)-like protein